MDELFIVNYCHPNCLPMCSITSLPESEAYNMAYRLSSENSGTAFYRFADFVNYYPRRIWTEKWLYDWFVRLGGEPTIRHPFYFVLNGSSYLDKWFDKGQKTKLPLSSISSKHISFTFGDSMAKMDTSERKDPFTKKTLLNMIDAYSGTIDMFFRDIERQCHYIEAQLWDDMYSIS